MSRPILTPRWGNPVNDNTLPRRSVIIAAEPFGCGFDVSVLPSVDGVGHDRELRTYREALAYAERLAERMGWRLVDLTGDGDRAA